MPKRVVDVMSCEVARAVRLTAKTVEYVSFKVPRKAGNFQADLFPPCKSIEPAMKFDDYIGGVDKEPLRQEMKPEDGFNDHIVAQHRKNTFLAKLGEKPLPVSDQAKATQLALNPDQQREIESLQKKVKELNDELSQSKMHQEDLQE